MARRSQWPLAMGTLVIALALFFAFWENPDKKAERLEFEQSMASVSLQRCEFERRGCAKERARLASVQREFDAFFGGR